ncbi:hypothetical protein BC939DRAFT_133307 [Gamsiella multidivaricata]|uniref:uncharacterized protein n=1 Tax=Gamsiella multidivaricata TaxID=101098 RepID=UPI00221E8C92|nr:uncharacterized protein BC939DRAFT_133307 [Gamsiella multidivaricata]KAI7825224.1 hypothetical protein BC939DRAFT_133307 [Gamsiella multidivaricata]
MSLVIITLCSPCFFIANQGSHFLIFFLRKRKRTLKKCGLRCLPGNILSNRCARWPCGVSSATMQYNSLHIQLYSIEVNTMIQKKKCNIHRIWIRPDVALGVYMCAEIPMSLKK